MLIDQLKKAHPEFADLRVREILIDKQNKTADCVLSYPEYDRLLPIAKDGIVETVKQAFPANFSCNVRFENDYFSVDSFLKFVFKLIKAHFVVLSVIPKQNFEVVEVSSRQFLLRIAVSPFERTLIDECKFQTQFLNLVNQFTCSKLEIEISLKQDVSDAIDLEVEREKQLFRTFRLQSLRPKRQFFVKDKLKHIGKLITDEPTYISDIRESRTSVTVFGTVKNKSVTVSKNNSHLKICKFLLRDESGEIPIVFFLRLKVEDVNILETIKNDAEKAKKDAKRNIAHNEKLEKLLATLFEGETIVVRGKAVLNDYSNKFEIHGFDLNRCRIEKLKPESVEKIPEPSEYTKIFPKNENVSLQVSLTDNQSADKDIVVIAVNTTGYNLARDKMLAVSMTKLRHKTIVSTLKCFLNPEVKIAQSLISDAGSDVDEFKNFPTLIEVLADLYKFSFGSILVGEDIELLANFLNYYGAPQGICFDNEKSQLGQMVETLGVKAEIGKRVNFSNVFEVAKKLGVPFDSKSMTQCFEFGHVASKCLEKLFAMTLKR